MIYSKQSLYKVYLLFIPNNHCTKYICYLFQTITVQNIFVDIENLKTIDTLFLNSRKTGLIFLIHNTIL